VESASPQLGLAEGRPSFKVVMAPCGRELWVAE
jgi:hypothetical protein